MKFFLSAILFLMVTFPCFAQDKCNTYSEPSLGVSFCSPPKWSIIKKDSAPYADIFGEKGNGFAPNINVQAGPFTGSVSETANSGIVAVLKTKGRGGVSKIEVKSKTKFAADTQGFKVVYDVEVSGLNIRSIQYFFKGNGDTKIVITATLPMSDADVLEGVIDKALKTFKIAK